MISFVAAMDKNRVIGYRHAIPWEGLLPVDKKRFRALTLGHTVVVGGHTFEELPKPFEDRPLVVITRDQNFPSNGHQVVHSIKEALDYEKPDEELMVTGGAQIFEQMLPYADRIYLTIVDGEFKGDTYFPELNPKDWKTTHRQDFKRDAQNQYNYSFQILNRV